MPLPCELFRSVETALERSLSFSLPVLYKFLPPRVSGISPFFYCLHLEDPSIYHSFFFQCPLFQRFAEVETRLVRFEQHSYLPRAFFSAMNFSSTQSQRLQGRPYHSSLSPDPPRRTSFTTSFSCVFLLPFVNSCNISEFTRSRMCPGVLFRHLPHLVKRVPSNFLFYFFLSSFFFSPHNKIRPSQVPSGDFLYFPIRCWLIRLSSAIPVLFFLPYFCPPA